MEGWDADYIDLTGPEYLTVGRDGSGFMQYGAIKADLDHCIEDFGGAQRLEFSFQGFDEGDPISGRGWATVEGAAMTGRIYFHKGQESGFTAVKDPRSKMPTRSSPKVIRLPNRPGAAKTRPFIETGALDKACHDQVVEIGFSGARPMSSRVAMWEDMHGAS